ncbi:MAG: glycosyltransferase [Ferruginibacter sp.]
MIPKILHFVFGFSPDFGHMSFSLAHHLAVKSAVVLNQPDKVYFHFQYEPRGEWWKETLPLITPNQLTAPTEIEGRPLLHFAHKSDVVRLRMLQEHGGIYLDMDTICVKPFDDLLQNEFVIGSEFNTPYVPRNKRQQVKYDIKKWLGLVGNGELTIQGLCNAVMLSAPGSRFVERWLREYKSFRSEGRDKYWDEHSVKVPGRLAEQIPETLTVLSPYAFFYPLYDRLSLAALFEEDHEYPQAYVHHLWESFAWEKYLSKLTPDDIRNRNTSYNRIARRYL